MIDLRDIWNWLPTFRAIAETQHLPTASKRLHVTPAAISRTLGLLEDRLGRPLFERSGRRLVLNGDGRALLARVQQAMAAVEGGLKEIDDQPLSGPVRLSTIGVLTAHFVLPAVLELRKTHPELIAELQLLGPRDAAQALLRGQIDAAFIYESMTLEGLRTRRLGMTTAAVYCGCGHPLFDADDVTIDDLLDHPFSVPQIGDTGQVQDGWPTDRERKIGMRITLLTTNLAVCQSGLFLTVLPDATALRSVDRGELRRFDFDLIDPIPLFAATRSTDSARSRSRQIVDAVARRCQELSAELNDRYGPLPR